jgi:hypothetical protein
MTGSIFFAGSPMAAAIGFWQLGGDMARQAARANNRLRKAGLLR